MSEIRSQATPARDELAEKVFDLLVTAESMGEQRRNVIAHGIAMGLEDAGWSKPRTVNSATELDALPVGSVIRSEDVTALKARNGAWLWDDGNYWEPLAGREVRVLFTPGDAG
ncbi:hypothetical protein [Rhodococcus erythropolis]|uniref:hypothetical protein n=1 Tax=Rhodococcus erythropolis TaxID=1833 RepID=UPI002225BD2B|nr:hypothetical protein [Rhodococcus erythropolis]MCW2300623.1 hypothetical protein [Rhodococcus erythropolis]